MDIQFRETCPTCDGSGYVASSFWEKFYEREREYVANNKPDPDELSDVLEGWLREMGYSGYNDRRLPSEQPTCSRCAGKGTVVEWASINDSALANQILCQHPEFAKYS